MISNNSYSKEWIESFRKSKEYSKVNPPLFEKMIHAFSLLEMLAKSGFEFVFKGGTSLLLMPIESGRFSVDIDIITENSEEELEHFIEKSIGESVFTSYKKDNARTNKGGIPKAHYSFNFNPVFNREGSVLLDVLFEKNPYSTLQKAEIKCEWVETSAPWLSVQIPSINGILGDKLTAFAPTTTGIPYWLNKPDMPDKRLEIVKQLYDVSNLIDFCTDTTETNQIFKTIANHQIAYRQLEIDVNNVTDDIFNTALILAKREKNKQEPEISYFAELQTGLRMFNEYLIKSKFRIEQAIEASAKAACFTQFMKKNLNIPFELYSPDSAIFNNVISNTEYNFLNRLKKTNKSAFYYWYKCLEKMGLLE